jgi:hypothetical protein
MLRINNKHFKVAYIIVVVMIIVCCIILVDECMNPGSPPPDTTLPVSLSHENSSFITPAPPPGIYRWLYGTGPPDPPKAFSPPPSATIVPITPIILTTPYPTITPVQSPKIARKPLPSTFWFGPLESIPEFNLRVQDSLDFDFRSYDLSSLDFRNSMDVLRHSSFDERTIWSASEFIPEGFDPEAILEIGKNPGLGIRSLHSMGVTGRGVNIAIIDKPLLVQHQEFTDHLHLYEEIGYEPDSLADMHGVAVASIAVGKTVGVAPEAGLYYIGARSSDWREDGTFTYNFSYYAEAIRRILAINDELPEGHKIRVISMQVGFSPDRASVEEVMEAIEAAKNEGMLVICSSVEDIHGFKFHGLGRDPLADPDRFESYRPGLWWAEDFYEGQLFFDRLMVPMDSRTTASPHGSNEYAFYRQGGWSWSIPYIAGIYTLAAQVQPDITPEHFWYLAMSTGRFIDIEYDGGIIPFGPIVDPISLIRAVQAK